jgi:hypothetical protein
MKKCLLLRKNMLICCEKKYVYIKLNGIIQFCGTIKQSFAREWSNRYTCGSLWIRNLKLTKVQNGRRQHKCDFYKGCGMQNAK